MFIYARIVPGNVSILWTNYNLNSVYLWQNDSFLCALWAVTQKCVRLITEAANNKIDACCDSSCVKSWIVILSSLHLRCLFTRLNSRCLVFLFHENCDLSTSAKKIKRVTVGSSNRPVIQNILSILNSPPHTQKNLKICHL